jgi:hypothetical protein
MGTKIQWHNICSKVKWRLIEDRLCKTSEIKELNRKMIYGGFDMAKSKSKKNGIVSNTYDLCLACTKKCKTKGPPWCRLECPSVSSSDLKYKIYRILDMTDNELLKRIAYA